MMTARRSASPRRVLAGFLALLLIAALAFVLAPAARAESSRINRMDITCRIDASGDAVITEVIDIDAYQGTEYYQVSNVRGNQQIRDLVVSENGVTFQDVGEWDVGAAEKRGRSGIVTTDSGYELCFGIGEYGNHVFEMRYTVENFVSRWSDSYGVNYMFFSDIPLDIESASVTLEGPDAYSDDNASIWAFGYEGDVVFRDGKVVMATDSSNLRGMQLLMVFENDRVFAHTNDYDADRAFMDVYEEAEEGSSYGGDSDSGSVSRSGFGKFLWFVPAIVAASMAGMAALFTKLTTKKLYEDEEGHKRAKSKSVTPYRDIPCDKDLVLFSRILTDLRGSREFLKSTLVAAYILKWLQKNIISVVEGPERGIIKKTQTYKIVLTESPAILDLNERHLYSMLWAAARDDHILEKNEFQRYCKKNYSDVERWFDSVRDAGTQRMKEKDLLRSERITDKMLGFIKTKRNADIYTVAYNEELAHVNGFQKFLEDEDNMAEKSMIEVKLWDEYLVFATVMGIADQVYRQAKLSVPQYDNRYYGYDPYMAYMVATGFGSAGARGVAAGASSSGGSSSFGGGGSSFSGGGGGGLR